MRFRRLLLAAGLVAAAGCNLLTGASDLDTSGEDPLPPPGADPDTGASPYLPEAGTPIVEGGDAPIDAGTDGRGVDARPDGPNDSGPVTNAKRVFVTSMKKTGAMNGLTMGDQLCADLAAAESLGGTWVAWLSIQNAVDAQDRLTHNGPWYLVDRMTLVATSKAQLGSLGGLAHAIDRDETNALVANDEVWTGTRAGKFYQLDCNSWNNATFGGGEIGRTNASNGNWTAATGAGCAGARRLYCFEN